MHLSSPPTTHLHTPLYLVSLVTECTVVSVSHSDSACAAGSRSRHVAASVCLLIISASEGVKSAKWRTKLMVFLSSPKSPEKLA